MHGHLDTAHSWKNPFFLSPSLFFRLGRARGEKVSKRGGGFRYGNERDKSALAAYGTSYLVKRIMPFPGGGRGGGEYYSGLTSINDADAQKTTTDTLNKSQSTPPEGLFVEADSL